jgi:hypothetical protein
VRDQYAMIGVVFGQRVSRMPGGRGGTSGHELRCDQRRDRDAAEDHERGDAPTPR